MAVKILLNSLKNKERVNFLLLAFVVVAIPFKINIGNFALILAFVFNVFFLKPSNLVRLKRFVFLFPVLFFFIVVVWAFFGKEFYEGISRLDRHLIPILITLVLANQNPSSIHYNRLITIFSWAVVGATIALLVNFFIGLLQGQTMAELTFHGFSSLFDQHPVYFSLYASLALFCFVEQSYKQGFALSRAIGTLVLLLGLLLSASKAILAMDMAIFVLYFGFAKIAIKRKLVLFSTIIILLFSAAQIGFLKERFYSGLTLSENIVAFEPTNDFEEKVKFSYQEKQAISDLDLRYLMAKISIYHLVQDKKVLFGYGPAMFQDYFDYYLYSYNLGPNWFSGFNVHNQYLHILLNYGVLVLILFLLYLALCIKVALKNKNYTFIAFLLLCTFVFLFEVVLIRNKGILFFYFFNVLFLIKNDRL